MSLWTRYKQAVTTNAGVQAHAARDLLYWRNVLFCKMLLYFVPVSIIAVIPGVIMSLHEGLYLLAVCDVCAAAGLLFLALSPAIAQKTRKICVVSILYVISLVLLVFLGSFGPGLLYLLAVSVFTTLIFSGPAGYWTIIINTLICVLFAILIQLGLIPSKLSSHYTVGAWIAVSSNLVFLGAVIVAGLNMLFLGLQSTIEKEAALQDKLRKESRELERMLNELGSKNKELEQFAYIASHDLQEPLRTISSLTELLEKEYGDQIKGDGTTYLRYLSLSTTRMRSLITALLNYSRIGTEGKPEQVDCNTIISQLVMDLDVLIRENDVQLIVSRLPVIQGYPIEFKRLLQNLITNAIKFRVRGETPRVEITAKDTGFYWTFSVSDNGIGIEPQYFEKIFVIFQRLHPRSQYEGTGIGLAYCRKIVELHGGKMWVESVPGNGSTFLFTIPK